MAHFGRPFNALPAWLALGAVLTMNAAQPQAHPAGTWFLAGSNRTDYVLSVDAATTHGGKPSQTLTCAKEKPEGFGTVMQDSVPTEYLGKRVRMSAWVKASKVTGWAGLWMRVDGPGRQMLVLDNMEKRPITGTSEWKPFEVVLDVAPEARNLAFGLLMAGQGQVWLDDLRFETVPATVPVTASAKDSQVLPGEMKPDAWYLRGSAPADYVTQMDTAVLRDGRPTHVLASQAESCKGFGTLMQMFKGTAFLGKRVRMSAWVKAERVEDWAGIWMRVDGPDGKSTAFDNMQSHAISGSRDWQRYQIVLDMAPDSAALALGVLVSGKGKVWMAEPTLEVVDAGVPVTDMKKLPVN